MTNRNLLPALAAIAYGNASIMAAATAVLWLLPVHHSAIPGQYIAGSCAAIATGALAAAARRIERAGKAGR